MTHLAGPADDVVVELTDAPSGSREDASCAVALPHGNRGLLGTLGALMLAVLAAVRRRRV